MPYITPQGEPLAYTPQRRARFPFPPQGIPVVVPLIPVWSMFMYDRYHRSVTNVSASVIYFGCEDYNVYALNADGTLKWSYATGGIIKYSSPVVDKSGVVYIGSYDGYLYALDANGTLKWRFYTEGGIFHSAAVDLIRGVIYVGSSSFYVFAIYLDGTEKWRYDTGYYVWSGVTLYDADIYTCNRAGDMFHLTPDGKEVCIYHAGVVIIISTPAIDDYGVVYIGARDYNLHAINPDCTLRWTFATGDAIRSSPSIDVSDNIYFGSDDAYMRSVRPDGTLRWSFNTGGDIVGGAALSDGVYIGSGSSYFFALTFDGTLRWSYETGDSIYASPAIDKDGVIFIGSVDYKMYSFNPDGTVRWTFTAGSRIYSSASVI